MIDKIKKRLMGWDLNRLQSHQLIRIDSVLKKDSELKGWDFNCIKSHDMITLGNLGYSPTLNKFEGKR